MLCLIATYGDTSVRLPVRDGVLRLGAGAENDLRLTFPGVSRAHATVERVDGGVRLRDAGSKNQFFVDGQRVAEVVLTPEMSVQLGRAVVTLDEISTADAEVGVPLSRQTESGSMPATTIAALSLVRSLVATEEPNAQVAVDRARDVVGASAIAIVTNDGNALVAVSGNATEIAASRRLPTGVSHSGNTTFFSARKGGRTLVAAFAAPSIDEWQRDLCDFLAARLLGSRPAEGAVEDAGGLRLPAEMVVGESAAMRSLLHQLTATINSRLDVVLCGETGTGKEVIARVIHDSGRTRRGAFVAINCAAIPAELLEAELFGVARRVATGVDPRQGRFQQANGGTILLDEIGELAAPLQAKLLRVLQEREVLPLGAAAAEAIDVRVIAATNRDLLALTRAGTFRADLYYRLRGLQFDVPPLRARREDIPAFVLAFAQRATRQSRKDVRGVSRKALELLTGYDWPGNVRELQHAVERAVLLCPPGGMVAAEHFAITVDEPHRERDRIRPLKEAIATAERAEIIAALRATNGNKSKAARLLGITRNGLDLKLTRLGIAQ